MDTSTCSPSVRVPRSFCPSGLALRPSVVRPDRAVPVRVGPGAAGKHGRRVLSLIDWAGPHARLVPHRTHRRDTQSWSGRVRRPDPAPPAARVRSRPFVRCNEKVRKKNPMTYCSNFIAVVSHSSPMHLCISMFSSPHTSICGIPAELYALAVH